MAQSYSFDRKDVDDLIEIHIHLGKSSINAILDTGATHTIIDLGVLIKEGYRLNDSKGIVFIETANGIIQANTFITSKLTCLGIEKSDFEVSSFLFEDPHDDVKGIIGLDFLQNINICLDFYRNKITIPKQAIG